MSKQSKEPINLSPLAYVAFWIGLFGYLSWLAYLNLGGK